MKELNNWLNANKISHVEKIELVIFKSPKNLMPDEIKVKLCGNMVYPTNQVNYLGLKLINSYTGMIK